MARIVLTDVSVTLNSVDLSDHIASVTLETNFDEVETTAFGSAARTRVAGLQDSSVSFDFHQDFAAAEVEATIYPLVGAAPTACVIKPTSGAVGADNPSYSFNVLINQWSPIAGNIGELAAVSVTWPISGAITKAVA
jgi:hypothetical protein